MKEIIKNTPRSCNRSKISWCSALALEWRCNINLIRHTLPIISETVITDLSITHVTGLLFFISRLYHLKEMGNDFEQFWRRELLKNNYTPVLTCCRNYYFPGQTSSLWRQQPLWLPSKYTHPTLNYFWLRACNYIQKESLVNTLYSKLICISICKLAQEKLHLRGVLQGSATVHQEPQRFQLQFSRVRRQFNFKKKVKKD